MLKMIDETLTELLISTTQETTQKILGLIKKNPSVTQEQMATELGITRDGVSYNIKKLKEQENLNEQVQPQMELGLLNKKVP